MIQIRMYRSIQYQYAKARIRHNHKINLFIQLQIIVFTFSIRLLDGAFLEFVFTIYNQIIYEIIDEPIIENIASHFVVAIVYIISPRPHYKWHGHVSVIMQIKL